MSNLLEYTLSLEDQMSAKLSKIGVNSTAALNVFANLEGKSKQVQQALKGTGFAVGALRQKLDLLRQERDWIPTTNIKAIRRYNTEIKKLEKQVTRFETINGSRTKRYFKEAFNQIPFGGLLMNPVVLAGAAASKAMALGIKENFQKTSFEVLLGGEEAGQKFFKDIKEYAKKTPFRALGVGDAAKTMLGFGIATEKVMPTLSAIGDIAMGDQERMKSLTLAFSQTTAAGKLMGQDLLQMINAGFNPLEQMSAKTGKSIGTLKEEMSKGAISAEMVEDAFISVTQEGGKFHNMSHKMSQTIGGRLSTMMDNINEKFLTLYGALQPVAMVMLNLVDYTLNALGDGANYVFTELKNGNPVLTILAGTLLAVAGAMGIMKIATMAQTGWTTILTTATDLLTAAWWRKNAAMLASPTTWIIAGVIALVAVIGYLVYKIDGWGKAWEHTVKAMGAGWSAYVSSFKLLWLSAEHLLLSGIDKIHVAWLKLRGLWDKEGSTSEIDRINAESDARKKAIVDEAKNIITQGKKAKEELAKAGASFSVNDKGFGSVKDSLTKKFGITAPKVPGTKIQTNLSGDKTKKGLEANKATATGGTKHNYITIKFNEVIGELNISKAGFKESVKQMEEESADAFLRVLGLAATANG